MNFDFLPDPGGAEGLRPSSANQRRRVSVFLRDVGQDVLEENVRQRGPATGGGCASERLVDSLVRFLLFLLRVGVVVDDRHVFEDGELSTTRRRRRTPAGLRKENGNLCTEGQMVD